MIHLLYIMNHNVEISEKEHCKFVEAFQKFKEDTQFDQEENVMKLKYFVQMAFLEGWKKKQVINEE